MSEPFVLVRPAGPAVPVLISSPHSGGHYPADERRRLGVHPDILACLSDGPVHELFLPAVRYGATLIHGLWSRAWVDLNRDPAEIDDETIVGVPRSHGARRSLRVRAGLGVVPTRVGERPVHQHVPTYRDVAARIAAVHLPFHAAIEQQCRDLITRFGQVLLLDCHSMPGGASGPSMVPDVVLGDRFGRSCEPQLVGLVEAMFRDAGFAIGRNQPFAGGWITERYGRPARNCHALQIEFRRDLFLDDRCQAQGHAHVRLRTVGCRLVEQLGHVLGGPARPCLNAAE